MVDPPSTLSQSGGVNDFGLLRYRVSDHGGVFCALEMGEFGQGSLEDPVLCEILYVGFCVDFLT